MTRMVVLWFRSMVHDGVNLGLGVTFWLGLRWCWRNRSSGRSRRAGTVVGGSLRLGSVAVVSGILGGSHRGCIGARWLARDNILCSLRSQRRITIALEQLDFRNCILAVSCV